MFWQQKNHTLYDHVVMLRPPERRDFNKWQALREQSQNEIKPYEAQWSDDHLTRSWYYAFLKRNRMLKQSNRGEYFLIFDIRNPKLIGGIGLSNIRYGICENAQIGYWTGTTHTKKGYMTKAVGLVLDYAFHQLQLKRIQALCMRDNLASIKVLEKNGFIFEGTARKALRICGKWQDHSSYSVLDDDWQKIRFGQNNLL